MVDFAVCVDIDVLFSAVDLKSQLKYQSETIMNEEKKVLRWLAGSLAVAKGSDAR